jgi:hypothetical protein
MAGLQPIAQSVILGLTLGKKTKDMNGRRKRRLPHCFEEISEAELRDIIKREASLLGLDPREAVRRAKRGTLPRNKLGDDLSLLVQLLPA